jgi:hypothetical protein
VVANPPDNEVWICFPEVGQKYATLALVWCENTGAFSYRSLKYGNSLLKVGSPNVAYGNIGETIGGETTWAAKTTNWNTDSTFWFSTENIQSINGLVGVQLEDATTSGLLQLDSSVPSSVALSSRPVVLQKTGMDLGDRESIKYISEVWPRITGVVGTILNMRIGGQFEPDDPVLWGPYIQYTIGSTKKIDTRFSARFMAIEVQSDSLNVWRLTGFDVKAQPAGRY